MCWLEGRLEKLAMSTRDAGGDPLEALLADKEFVEGLEQAYPELLALREAENLALGLKGAEGRCAARRKL